MEQSAPLPRRIQMNLNFPAERAIFNAMRAVEKLPASEKLTKAIQLLAEAKEEVRLVNNSLESASILQEMKMF